MRPARHGAAVPRIVAQGQASPATIRAVGKVRGARVGPDATEPAAGQTAVMLRVLATTDLHANVMSYDYAANRPMNGLGLAQMASLIAAARAKAPGALLLDNGDFLQGTALADLAAQNRRRRAHPVIAAMNALGYDAATLGNHEFNFGLEVLQRALAQARFPAVSANVLLRKGTGVTPLVPPYAILDRVLPDNRGRPQVLRIGILGLTPPEILQWDQAVLQGRLDARSMIEAAQDWVPRLRQAGADVVICLAHTGIADRSGSGREGLGADLAEVLGIDALVLGHSHLVFPNRSRHPDPRVDPAAGLVAGKPVVQPGHSGSHLGVMDLQLIRSSEGWRVAGAEVRAESVSEVAAGLAPAAIRSNAEALRRVVGDDHRAALAWTRRELGRTEIRLSTTFSQVADTAALRLLGLAKIDHARRVLAGTPHESLPVVATATPFRAGGRGGPLNYTAIAPGSLSVRHVFDLYPFPNLVLGYLTTGATLAEILERSAAIYRRIIPGEQDQMLIDPAFPVHAFTTLVGLSYEIDPSQPARYDLRGQLIRPGARRVRNLTRGGLPVRPEDRFVLVTNNFRASGALGDQPPLPGQMVLERRELCTDVLRDFIRGIGMIRPSMLTLPDGWRLSPLPGTSVLCEVGPEAMGHGAEAADLRPESAGLTVDGFHLIRLQL